MSTSEARKRASDGARDGHKRGSKESEYLRQQANEAKAAITRTFAELGGRLGQSVDVRLWTKQSPWLTLGSATVAAFVATSLLVPSKEQQALRKLAAIERALTPAPPTAAAVPKADENGANAAQYQPGKQSLLTMITRELIGAIKPAVISILTAGVTASQAKPTEAEMQAAAAKQSADQAAGAPPTSST